MYMLLAGLLLMQLPFMVADPDFNLSHSRDAHSDEGLNTSQVRNFVNYGYVSAWECDNLIKNPLFNVLMAGPFFAFGTRLWVGRGTVLLFVLATLFFISRNRTLRWFWMLFIPVTLLQFHIFSYARFSMAEMVAISCILSSVYHCFRFIQRPEPGKRKKHLILAILFSSLAWYFKIQFIYMLFFVPLVFIAWWIKKIWTTRQVNQPGFILALTCITLSIGFVAAYYFAWYLPLKAPYTYIMNNQASNRFGEPEHLWPIISENYNRYFTQRFLTPLLFVFYLSVIPGILFYFFSPGKVFRALFPVALCWILLESHKLAIHFVPSRYLVSSYVAIGLFSTTVIYEALRRFILSGKVSALKRYAGWITLTSVLWLMYNYAITYNATLHQRTFNIHAVNSYLSHYNLKGLTVAGPWAPSLTWDTKARAVPVWSGFLNDKNIIQNLDPVIIFSEPDEADSEQAFKKDGIDLSLADSVKSYKIGRWPVNLYWMN